jgi:hypothetical protein
MRSPTAATSNAIASRIAIVRLIIELRLHQIEQRMRSGEAADVSRLDPVDILLDAHGRILSLPYVT